MNDHAPDSASTDARTSLQPDPALQGGPRTLAEAFVASVRTYKDRDAVKPLGAPPITYGELAVRVEQATAVLQGLGIGDGDRIAVWLPNGVSWLVLTCAAALVGACVVPINTRYRPDELLYALGGSEARVLFTQSAFLSNPLLGRLREAAGGEFRAGAEGPIPALPALRTIVMMDDAREQGTVPYADLWRQVALARPIAELAAERRPEQPMWLFWTSGTTSRPKAALMPQSTIEIVWQWTTLAGYRASDRVLTARPLFYIAGHFWCMLGPLLHGACIVIGDRFTTEEMVGLCRDEGVSVLSGNPMMFKRLIQDPGFDPSAFATVRLGYFSGSGLPLEEMRAIHAAIGFTSFMHTYGMTELGGFIMSTLPGDDLETACRSCGTPFTDIDLRLVSAETGRDVPVGEVGLLVTRKQKLLRYLNVSDEEQARLYGPDGWFRTGDLMRQLPDGRYQMVGRAKDLIKVGGENVTAAEIEDTLMKHPAVSLVAVIGRVDDQRGEVPVAFVELKPGTQGTVAELRSWSQSQMAPFKVPAEIYQVRAEEWPMTATGKIAKHELAARAAGPSA